MCTSAQVALGNDKQLTEMLSYPGRMDTLETMGNLSLRTVTAAHGRDSPKSAPYQSP